MTTAVAPQTAVTAPKKSQEIEFIPMGDNTPIKLSLNIVKEYIAIPTKNKLLPDERECMRFLMLCRSRKLNPFEGDCFLMGYEGRDGIVTWSLITAHQAFLKRAEVHPEFDGFESGVIVREGEDGDIKDREGDFLYPGDILLGGWCTVHFKNRKHPMKRRLNVGTFKKAYGRWNDDAAGMIVKCAEADGLRSSFPTLLGGLYTDNERPVIEIGGPSNVKSPDFSEPPRLLPTPATSASQQAEAPGKPQGAPEGATTPGAAQTPQGEAAGAPAGGSGAEPEPGNGGNGGAGEPDQAAELLKSIKLHMEKAGVTEEQVMTYARGASIAKADQKRLSDLSTAKLTTINKSWHNILPKIRGGQ